MTFEQKLEMGRVIESVLAKYFMARGCTILPVYEKLLGDFKGPQIFSLTQKLTAPDMLVFTKEKQPVFVESKMKTVFGWQRKTSAWTTGIDLRHYEDYQEVRKITGVPLWIAFFHQSNIPYHKDLAYGCPSECPTGLFAQDLDILTQCESLRSEPFRNGGPSLGHGSSGMVYWKHESLIMLNTLEEVYRQVNAASAA